MLLPIDDSVLKENPRFANLYKTLTTEILNPDCSTKDDLDPTAGQRNAVREVSFATTMSPSSPSSKRPMSGPS